MDYVSAGKIIKLGPKGQVVLGYMKSCWRETITGGSYDARLDADRDFGVRLSQQTGKQVLIDLGVTVAAFYTAARNLRNAQNTAKSVLEDARQDQEPLRLAAVDLDRLHPLRMTGAVVVVVRCDRLGKNLEPA